MKFEAIKNILIEDLDSNKIIGAYNTMVKSSTFAASLLFNIENLKKDNYLGKKYIEQLKDIEENIDPVVGARYGRGDFQYFANNGSLVSGMLINENKKSIYVSANLDVNDNYANEFDTNENALYYVPKHYNKVGEESIDAKINRYALENVNHLFIDDGSSYYIYAGEFRPELTKVNDQSRIIYKNIPYEVSDKLTYLILRRNKRKKILKTRPDKTHLLRDFNWNRKEVGISNFKGSGGDNREALAKSKNNHEKMILAIAKYYKEKYSNDPNFKLRENEEDLVVYTSKFTRIIEVKTTKSSNIKDQLKTALGQILFYKERYHNKRTEMEVVYSDGKIPDYINSVYKSNGIYLIPVGKYI